MVVEIDLVFPVTFVVTNGNTVGFQRKGGARLSKKPPRLSFPPLIGTGGVAPPLPPCHPSACYVFPVYGSRS